MDTILLKPLHINIIKNVHHTRYMQWFLAKRQIWFWSQPNSQWKWNWSPFTYIISNSTFYFVFLNITPTFTCLSLTYSNENEIKLFFFRKKKLHYAVIHSHYWGICNWIEQHPFAITPHTDWTDGRRLCGQIWYMIFLVF